MTQRPIIDQRIARPGIEGQDLALARPDPGDIGDAAQIEHGERPLQPAGQGAMPGRDEGAPWPPAATSALRKSETTATPRCCASCAPLPIWRVSRWLRPVQDGVAVEADDVDAGQPVPLHQGLDRPPMELGQLLLDAVDGASVALLAQDAAQPRPEAVLIRQC